jgi:hypothetical protein
MKKLALVLATGFTTACLTLPAGAQEFVDCNMNGIDNIKTQDKRDHVFYARLGNKGKGNGGESIDVSFDVGLGLVTKVTCVSTASEDTNGTLTVDGILVLPDSEFLPEIDPGKNQPRP